MEGHALREDMPYENMLLGGHVLPLDVEKEHEYVIRSRSFDFIRLCCAYVI